MTPRGRRRAPMDDTRPDVPGVRGGRVHATAVALHVGRTTVVVQTDLR